MFYGTSLKPETHLPDIPSFAHTLAGSRPWIGHGFSGWNADLFGVWLKLWEEIVDEELLGTNVVFSGLSDSIYSSYLFHHSYNYLPAKQSCKSAPLLYQHDVLMMLSSHLLSGIFHNLPGISSISSSEIRMSNVHYRFYHLVACTIKAPQVLISHPCHHHLHRSWSFGGLSGGGESSGESMLENELCTKNYLVGGFNPFEKYESHGKLSPIFGVKIKKYVKPPDRYVFCMLYSRNVVMNHIWILNLLIFFCGTQVIGWKSRKLPKYCCKPIYLNARTFGDNFDKHHTLPKRPK